MSSGEQGITLQDAADVCGLSLAALRSAQGRTRRGETSNPFPEPIGRNGSSVGAPSLFDPGAVQEWNRRRTRSAPESDRRRRERYERLLAKQRVRVQAAERALLKAREALRELERMGE